jgi:hypothetical protein
VTPVSPVLEPCVQSHYILDTPFILGSLQDIKIYGGAEAYFHSFLKSTLDEVVNFTLQPPYPQSKKSFYPWDSWVGDLRAVLDPLEKR